MDVKKRTTRWKEGICDEKERICQSKRESLTSTVMGRTNSATQTSDGVNHVHRPSGESALVSRFGLPFQMLHQLSSCLLSRLQVHSGEVPERLKEWGHIFLYSSCFPKVRTVICRFAHFDNQRMENNRDFAIWKVGWNLEKLWNDLNLGGITRGKLTNPTNSVEVFFIKLKNRKN